MLAPDADSAKPVTDKPRASAAQRPMLRSNSVNRAGIAFMDLFLLVVDFVDNPINLNRRLHGYSRVDPPSAKIEWGFATAALTSAVEAKQHSVLTRKPVRLSIR